MTKAYDLAKLRVSDPVLTNLALGYKNNDLVGTHLMPVVEIEKEAGKIPTFGRLAFRLNTTTRTLRGKSNRIDPEDLGSIAVTLEEKDVEFAIDYREDNDAFFNLRAYAVQTVSDVIALGREKEIATLAQNEASYEKGHKVTLSGTSKFSHPDAEPFLLISEAIATIKRATGRKPNICVIASNVWQVLKNHPKVLAKIENVRVAVMNETTFAQLIEVDQVIIGEAVYEETNELKDIWSNSLILAYTPKGTRNSVYEPSFGYTIRRKGGLFVDTYVEEGGKIEVVRATDIHKPHLVGKPAGYLITNCL